MRVAGVRPAPRAWASVAIALALGALALWFAPREAFDWQPGLAVTQPWRLWTAALVHLSPLHLQANLLGCAVVAAFGTVAGVPRRAAWAWLAAWPLTHAALALQPRLLHYGGLSGLLHAGVAVAALHIAWQAPRHHRFIGLAVLVGLGAKLAFEQAWIGPTQAVAGWDIRIAPLAHLTGAAAGLLCGTGALWIDGGRPATGS
ncbi:MAG: rhombosortase [Burkholderiaceae bacterium]|nr:rhombosortase [Burkholderiaceae bacterium]